MLLLAATQFASRDLHKLLCLSNSEWKLESVQGEAFSDLRLLLYWGVANRSPCTLLHMLVYIYYTNTTSIRACLDSLETKL